VMHSARRVGSFAGPGFRDRVPDAREPDVDHTPLATPQSFFPSQFEMIGDFRGTSVLGGKKVVIWVRPVIT
jgi:hypothetical protein